MGTSSSLLSRWTEYALACPECPGGAFAATDNSVDQVYPVFGNRPTRLPIWTAAENSPVHRVPRVWPGRVHRWLSPAGWAERGLGRRLRRGLERHPVEDVVLGGLDPVEAEGAHRLDQDHAAGDDRRGAVGVQAGDRGALGEGGGGEQREQVLDRLQREDAAVHARRVVWLEAEVGRGERGWRACDRDPGRGAGAVVAVERRRDQRAGVGGELLQLDGRGRVAGD